MMKILKPIIIIGLVLFISLMITQSNSQASSSVELSIPPGWNLISVPFTLVDPDINSAIPMDQPVDIVMEWVGEQSIWLVSRRSTTTGLFEGDVKTMTPKTGYFVRATGFAVLPWSTPRYGGFQTPPPVPSAFELQKGLNLVPVVSSLRPVPVGVSADAYLSGVNWLKAFTYNPVSGTWISILPGDTVEVEFGKTNPCTGQSPVARKVQTGGEPCQSFTGGAAFTDVDSSGTFNAGDSMRVKAPLMLGHAYWVYTNDPGVVIP